MFKKLINRLKTKKQNNITEERIGDITVEAEVKSYTQVAVPMEESWEKDFVCYNQFSMLSTDGPVTIEVCFRDDGLEEKKKEEIYKFIREGFETGNSSSVIPMFCFAYEELGYGIGTKVLLSDNILKLFVGKRENE